MTSLPFFAAALVGANATGDGDWRGVVYTGICWRAHNAAGLPLPGVGLANTLFGLLAGVTFLLMISLVYSNRRKARAYAEDGRASRSGSGAAGAFLADSFAALGDASNSLVGDASSASVSFSSYVKFIQVSAAWASLWVVFNLFPQLSSGRDLPTLWWHAVVASLVYTASVFLELGVVVFLLNDGVGQKAFRSAAAICGGVAILYGALNLYFRLADDVPPAHQWTNYPIGQLDFISSRPTILFLIISSGMLVIFFVTTIVVVMRAPAVEVTRRRRRRHQRTTHGEAHEHAKGERPTSSLMASVAGHGTPTKSTPTTATTMLVTPTTMQPGYQSEGEWSRRPAPSSDGGHTAYQSLAISPEIRVTAAATMDGGRRSPSPQLVSCLDEDAPPERDSRTPSPSPSFVGVGSSSARATHAPKRRSVVLYSLFLAMYYTMKTTGLCLLYVEKEAGICLLDGGILLYMAIYAFLLYYTLLQDSRYWHELLGSVEVQQEQGGAHEEQVLLTESSRGSAARSPLLRAPVATRSAAPETSSSSHRHTSSDDRSSRADEEKDRVGGLPISAVAAASSLFTSPRSRQAHGRSGSVLLKDFLIPPNQLTVFRTLVVPEAAKANAIAQAATTAAANAQNARRRHPGSGASSSRNSPAHTPAMSRSGSGSGATAMALGLTSSASGASASASKWTLSHVSSRVGAGLRVVTGQGPAGGHSSGGGGSGSSSGGGLSDRRYELLLARKGAGVVGLKQFTLPSLTAEFFRRDFQTFLSLVPMGPWLGCAQAVHANIAQVLGVTIDPPCISLVFEYGMRGTLYDFLHPALGVPVGAVAITVSSPNAAAAYDPVSPPYQSMGPHGTMAMAAAAAGAADHADTSGPTAAPTRVFRSPSVGAPSAAVLQACKLASQIARAMASLQRWSGYDAHPLHLNPTNILLTETFDALVCDLGAPALSSSAVASSSASSAHNRKRITPAPAWAAPEVLAGGVQTRASAVYSWGMVLWGLLTHRYPCVLVARDVAPEPSRSHSASSTGSRSHSASTSFSSPAHHIPSSIVKSGTSATASSLSPPVAAAATTARQPTISGNRRAVSIIRTSRSAPPVRLPSPNHSPASMLLSSPLVTGGIAASSSIVVGAPTGGSGASTGAASPAGDLSPPSSPRVGAGERGRGSRPASPSHRLDSDDEQAAAAASDDDGDTADDGDGVDEEDTPVPITYVSVDLTDLKLCQRFVLTEGVRPAIPLGCPASVAQLLRNCWDENPDDRPSFDIIVEYLDLHQKDIDALDLPLALPGGAAGYAAAAAAAAENAYASYYA